MSPTGRLWWDDPWYLYQSQAFPQASGHYTVTETTNNFLFNSIGEQSVSSCTESLFPFQQCCDRRTIFQPIKVIFLNFKCSIICKVTGYNTSTLLAMTSRKWNLSLRASSSWVYIGCGGGGYDIMLWSGL